MSRILIIGLDGGTFDLIKPWVNEGKLPNIAKLMHSGAHGNLRTTIPPMTFPAWNAFMTGTNPGKHGVLDFTERKPGTYELEIKNAQHRKRETIWKIASKYGGKCAVIGVPVTYPPEEINGIMISGFDAPYSDERIMYPEELFFELKERVGQYLSTENFVKPLRAGRIDRAVETMHSVIDRKADTAKYILRREPWDLFMIVFGETDAAIHHFWKYHDKNSPQRNKNPDKNPEFDPIYEVYQRVDKHIGEIIEIAPEETVVILMSDHGAGGTSDKVLYLNRFLESHGLLTFKVLPLRTYLNKKIDRLKASIKKLLPKEWLKRLRFTPQGIGLKWEAKLRFSTIDWEHTKVYAEETPFYPNVTINLKGREPDGIVDTSDYKSLVDRTIALLHEWRDQETNNNVVKKAYHRDALYWGDYTGRAPDIFITWNFDRGYSYMHGPSFASKKGITMRKLDERIFENSDYMLNRSGSHRDEGIFIIAGKPIETGVSVDNVEILDLAPTILYLLDVPIPGDMDGKIVFDCFKKEYIKKPLLNDMAISTTKSDYHYSDKETDEIKKRLKGLGYL